jgi:alpha-tubulin suppressor-like RCC1 family protein
MVNIDAISAGFTHSMVLFGDGTVNIWGKDGYLNPMVTQPGLGGVLSIASGGNTAAAIIDPAKNTAPVITVQPRARTILENEPVDFAVKLYGFAPFTYQWRRNGISIPGATSSGLHISAVQPGDIGAYDVVITNAKGSVTSTAAALDMLPLPVVTARSSSRQVLVPGWQLDLSVSATGTGPLSYQWMHNNQIIAGATAASYSIATSSMRDAGWYVVLISDDNGVRRSAPFFVIVAPAVTRVRAWGGGSFSYGGDQVPSGLTNVVKISAGPGHSLALKSDGTVVAWGDNTDGESVVPAGLTDVVDLAACYGTGGYGCSVVLKSNGTVVQWGQGGTLPAGLTDVVSIAAGADHFMALKSDGTVVSWANGLDYSSSTEPPVGLKNVVAIVGGYNRSIALKGDGTVVTWGVGYSDETSMPPGLGSVIGVASGNRHSLALKSDGTVVAWGYNSSGQLDVPVSLTNVAAVSASAFYSLALKTDGTAVEWGNSGQTTPPADLDNVTAISAGYNFSLALQAAPIFTSQPGNVEVSENQTASFVAPLLWSGGSNFQWQKNGLDIPGANGSSYVIAQVNRNDAGNYRVVATNSVGSTVSQTAILNVRFAPEITVQPLAHYYATAGGEVTLSVTVAGYPVPTYQWRKNGVNISGANGSLYTITNVAAGDAGTYSVQATNAMGSATSVDALLVIVPYTAPTTKVLGDFDGDGKADLFWSNTVTGERSMWFLNGNTTSGGASLGTVSVPWEMSATGDFDGDGKADIFWTNPLTGDRAIWLMNGSAMRTNTFMGTVPADWVISGTGDFNGDGKADLVWTNRTTGDRAMWLMNGNAVLGGGYLGTISVDWVIAGVGDFDGDGKADLIWSNTVTGERSIWFQNGSTTVGGATLNTVPVAWVISGVGDFNGDGKADVFLTNTVSGDRVIWLMDGSSITTNAFMGTVPVEWIVSGTGDFNADGKKDVFWTNTATGDRAIWLLNGSTVTGGGFMGTVPVIWTINN